MMMSSGPNLLKHEAIKETCRS